VPRLDLSSSKNDSVRANLFPDQHSRLLASQQASTTGPGALLEFLRDQHGGLGGRKNPPWQDCQKRMRRQLSCPSPNIIWPSAKGFQAEPMCGELQPRIKSTPTPSRTTSAANSRAGSKLSVAESRAGSKQDWTAASTPASRAGSKRTTPQSRASSKQGARADGSAALNITEISTAPSTPNSARLNDSEEALVQRPQSKQVNLPRMRSHESWSSTQGFGGLVPLCPLQTLEQWWTVVTSGRRANDVRATGRVTQREFEKVLRTHWEVQVGLGSLVQLKAQGRAGSKGTRRAGSKESASGGRRSSVTFSSSVCSNGTRPASASARPLKEIVDAIEWDENLTVDWAGFVHSFSCQPSFDFERSFSPFCD